MTLLTSKELAAGLGMPERTVRHKLKSVPPQTFRPSRGGQTKVYGLDQLPDDLRLAWLRRGAIADGLAGLADLVASMGDRSAPTAAEESLFWDALFQAWEAGPIEGAEALGRRAAFLDWVARSCPWIEARGHALYVTWCRKLDRWIHGDRKPSAFLDRRADANRARSVALPERDHRALVALATLKHGGRVSEAWRNGLQSDLLSEPTKGRFVSNPSRKSYVPATVRREIGPVAKALASWHRGPRTGGLRGAWIDRDWLGIAAGDWFSADDVTLPVVFWLDDGDGNPVLDEKGKPVLRRGQALLMNDERSRRILDFCLLPTEGYSAFAIRTLFNKVFSRYGLPRKGLLLENGIWRKSKLLKGDPAACEDEEIELGLREFVEFRHTHTPRGKVIERIIGLAQNRMEAHPGYVGRAEMTDKFERENAVIASVRAGRRHPAESGLFSMRQWFSELGSICEAYNAEPMQSKAWPGETISPDDAWARFQNQSDPPIGFPPRLRYLLAHHRRQVTVTGNGAAVQFGNRRFVYRDAQTAALVGRPVILWFDPECPEFACLTDLNRGNPVCVPLAPSVSYNASPDEIEGAARSVASQNSYAKGLYSSLRAEYLPKLRPVAPSWESVRAAELGDRIRANREAAVEAGRARDRGRRVLREIGLPDTGRRLADTDVDELAQARAWLEAKQ
ncbi:MAG TPA: hypothetical protein PKM43_06910 [Verrucomicrobiota bacterium]|nr:hypothetical protein [Verrucomicrobiota bacterium]